MLEPFFIGAGDRARFCLLQAPADSQVSRVLLFVQPFAEELNKSRRMIAMQSRELAANGCAVLHIDLKGCGDSCGDLSETSWDDWLDDINAAEQWLRQRYGLPVILWGLRLGCLLALDYGRRRSPAVAGLIMWAPVVHGRAFLNQFLRIRTAALVVAGEPAGTKSEELRQQLLGGQPVEVAGYTLGGSLAKSMDELNLTQLAPNCAQSYWFEMALAGSQGPSPAVQNVLTKWAGGSGRVDFVAVPGEQFWASQEILECPALVAATLRAVRNMP